MKTSSLLALTVAVVAAAACMAVLFLGSASGSKTENAMEESSIRSRPLSSATNRLLATALVVKGNNKSPASSFPLGVCQGDCDSDSECATGLKCFQRSGTQAVPGCSGASKYSGTDFCYDPKSSSSNGGTSGGTSGGGTSSGNLPQVSTKGNNKNPSSAFPLGKCQGDCDSDDDCQPGLVCYQRVARESVPGCSGGTSDSTANDYCIDPFEQQSIPPQNTDHENHSGKTFALKIYWQQGYMWQEESFERKWCVRCNGDRCSAGRRVYITNCDIDSAVTEWELNYVTSSNFQIKVSNSNLCLTVPDDETEPIIIDDCNTNNERQLYRAQNGTAAWGSHFEINAVWDKNTCVSITHHPKYSETLYLYNCLNTRKWTTGAWNFY
ncbi:hypothetical protein MPSEU_000657600 [Mayamaea pseudoterrestris]|nr:hypothetical protein MPSEU_000657600 [Mayamaea pseudoterrestris]